MNSDVVTRPVKTVCEDYPDLYDFFHSTGLPRPADNVSMLEYAALLEEEILEDRGFIRSDLVRYFLDYVAGLQKAFASDEAAIGSLQITAGRDKSGVRENAGLVLKPGDIVAVVGPTGSGKSRLLADIEWMAQADTQTGRRVLIDERPVDPKRRHSSGRKLVAQLSQNMNFIADMSVGEFITMHAGARGIKDAGELGHQVIATANTIAGEPIEAGTKVTSLSGGQSRAFMIADTAIIGQSPVILIDEIENAGIDRRAALDLLVKKRKIILIATHDPVLALMADRRVVLRNGGIRDVITTSPAEKENLEALQRIDGAITAIRNDIRDAKRIEAPFGEWLPGQR
ncbi:MAG: ATP-binding cassette domain-containing protein [Syntrophorhabdaceae bacterium]